MIVYSFNGIAKPKVNALSIFRSADSLEMSCAWFYFANAISHNFGETSLPRLGEKRASEIK